MTEFWKPVYGWEGKFEVSNIGRVKRVEESINTFAGRILSGRAEKYVRVLLTHKGVRSLRSVHSLVLEAFVCPRPSGLVGNHKNGNKHDNRLENLEWVTPSENTQHGFDVLHRNTLRGENHGMAKLTNSKAKKIRQLYKTGKYGQWTLARLFHIGRSSIQRVVSGATWRENEQI